MKPLSVLLFLVATQVIEASTIYDENVVVGDNKVIRRTQRSEELTKVVNDQKTQIINLTSQVQTCDKDRSRAVGEVKTCNEQVININLTLKNIQAKYDTLFISFNDSQKQLDKCNSEFKSQGNDFGQQIKRLTDQNAELGKQGDDLIRRLKKAEDLVIEWEGRYKALQEQNNGQKKDCDTLNVNFENARRRITKLESDVNEQTARGQQCRDEFVAFRNQSTARDNDFQAVREQLKKTGADLDASKTALIKATADFDVLRQTADKCRKDFDIQIVSFNDLQGKFTILDQRFNGATTEFNNFKIENQKLVDRFTALQKVADNLTAERDNCRKNGDNFKIQIDQLTATINEINIRLGDFRQRAEKAEAQIVTIVAQYKKEKQDSDRSITDLNNAIADWQGRFKARETDFLGLQERCTKQLNEADSRFGEIRSDRDTTRKAFEELKITFKQIQDTAAQYEKDLRAARERGDRVTGEFNSLRALFDKLQTDNNDLTGRFRKTFDDFTAIQNQFKRCDGDLVGFRDRATKAEAIIVQVNGKLDETVAQRDKLTKDGEDLRKQIRQEKDKLDKVQKQLDKTLALCDLEVGDALVGSAYW